MIISITPDLALDEGYTYAGGLGVLEGDKFYGAAKLGVPYKVLTFLYREGYVDYDFDGEGRPVAKPQHQPHEFMRSLVNDDTLTVRLKDEDVKVEILKYRQGEAEAVFFRPVEPKWAAKLSNRLYIWENGEEKFYTYTLLAKTAAEYVKRYVGVAEVDYIDLQEAYACILPLVLKIPGKYRIIIHTAGPWGHPSFPRDLFEREFGYKFIGGDVFLTEVGLAASREAFTVSAKHFEVMSNVIPQFMDKLHYVTNGVNIDRWMDPALKAGYDRGNMHLDNFITARYQIRRNFLKFIRRYKDVEVGNRLIVAWCRRLAPYKRPDFILRAIEEMSSRNIFFVLGGKAHPQDGVGLEYMRLFRKMHLEHENVVYIPDYDVASAKEILKSADLLLFTPFSGWEACGTSYMKAGINGVPSLSSHDGGAVELITDNVNGWLFGTHLRELIELHSDAAGEINRHDYSEFKKRLSEIDIMNRDKLEKYYKVSLNALTTFNQRVNIERTLKEYYRDMIKTASN